MMGDDRVRSEGVTQRQMENDMKHVTKTQKMPKTRRYLALYWAFNHYTPKITWCGDQVTVT